MEEIEELLSNPMFEIPGESSMCNSPRGQPLTDLPDPMASKEENSSNAGEALLAYGKQPPPPPHGSSQVDIAYIMAHSSHSLSHCTLERDTSPTPFPLLANSINLLDNILHIQEEMNEAMVHLLSARAAIDMHFQQALLETEASHCQNEINTPKVIREVKAQYASVIGDTEAIYGTTMRKPEAVCSASTSKVEVIGATRIRKANAMQASKLQWQYQEAMCNLEEEALEVEKYAHQSFLWACRATLQACPNEALAKLMYPLHLLMGSPPLPSPLMVTSPLAARLKNPVTSPHCPSRPMAAVPSTWVK